MNQDQFTIVTVGGSLFVEQSSFDQPSVQSGSRRAHVFIVADGMGGHAGGQHASALAVRAVEAYLVDVLGAPLALLPAAERPAPPVTRIEEADEDRSAVRARPSVFEHLERAMQRADDVVIAEANARSELSNMGTTLTLACIVDQDLYVAHAGDSRCYLWRGGALTQITRDHTIVGQMVEAGVLSPEEARTHHMRHVVTNVVGGGKAGVTAEIHAIRLAPGDSVVMCSDGLNEVVPLEKIAETLIAHPDPAVACAALIDAANDAGSPDNVTVVIASLALAPALRPTEPPRGPDTQRGAPFESGWFGRGESPPGATESHHPSGPDDSPLTFEGARGGIIGHGMP